MKLLSNFESIFELSKKKIALNIENKNKKVLLSIQNPFFLDFIHKFYLGSSHKKQTKSSFCICFYWNRNFFVYFPISLFFIYFPIKFFWYKEKIDHILIFFYLIFFLHLFFKNKHSLRTVRFKEIFLYNFFFLLLYF